MAGSGWKAAKSFSPGSFISGFAVICWIVNMSIYTPLYQRLSATLVLSALKLAPKCQMSSMLLGSGGGWSSGVLAAVRKKQRSSSRGQSHCLHSLPSAELHCGSHA